MALLKCPECGASVSEFAEYCPKCGCPMYDIALENQVDDKQWDHKKALETTNTNMYDPKDLEKAVSAQKAQQRKPGQKKIVKNAESSLPKWKKAAKVKSKAAPKGKKKKINKVPLVIAIAVILIAGGFIYYFAMVAPDRPDEEETLPTVTTEEIEETEAPQQDYNEDPQPQPPETEPPAVDPQPTQAPTTQKPETEPPTTQAPTTQAPTTQPPTQAPPEPQDPNQVPGGEDA